MREEEERVGRGKRKVQKEECLVQEGRERYCTAGRGKGTIEGRGRGTRKREGDKREEEERVGRGKGNNREEDGKKEKEAGRKGLSCRNKRKRKGSDGKFRYEKRKGARKRFS